MWSSVVKGVCGGGGGGGVFNVEEQRVGFSVGSIVCYLFYAKLNAN